MYLIELVDGWVFGTSTKEICQWLQKEHQGEIHSVVFVENLDRAIDRCDEVIE